MTFVDRTEAGRRLAVAVKGAVSAEEQPVVMGMARGGVPVAFEVAGELGARLDVVVVRKLGHPRQPELGLGAIAEDGVLLVNADLMHRLGVTDEVLNAVTAQQTIVLDRRLRTYRGVRAPIPVKGHTAIVVDDGLATGFTARAAIEVMRRREAARVVLAVPVGPPDTVESLHDVADAVVCLITTERFLGLSEWYDDFSQVSDEEVARLLATSASMFPPPDTPDTPDGPDAADSPDTSGAP